MEDTKLHTVGDHIIIRPYNERTDTETWYNSDEVYIVRRIGWDNESGYYYNVCSEVRDNVYVLHKDVIPVSEKVEDKPLSVLDIQHGGSHYKDKAIQPVEYIAANGLKFFEGNIIKYATRHEEKNGAEDVRKIIHYAQFILKFTYGEEV